MAIIKSLLWQLGFQASFRARFKPQAGFIVVFLLRPFVFAAGSARQGEPDMSLYLMVIAGNERKGRYD